MWLMVACTFTFGSRARMKVAGAGDGSSAAARDCMAKRRVGVVKVAMRRVADLNQASKKSGSGTCLNLQRVSMGTHGSKYDAAHLFDKASGWQDI